MYYILFRYGTKLSLSRLVLETYQLHHIVPSQLVSNAWRIMTVIQVITELREVPFTYENISHTYSLQRHMNDNGLFVLVNRFDKPLIPKVPDSYKSWAQHYIHVPSNMLSASSDFNVPHSWSLLGIFLILENYDPICLSLCMYVHLTD